jgi:hypothetical protein
MIAKFQSNNKLAFGEVMSSDKNQVQYLDANQIVYLPFWARLSILFVLGLLTIISAVCGVAFLFDASWRDKVVPLLSIAQTAAGGFALVLFVLFAERQISTERLLEKTNYFLDILLPDTLAKIELPQISKNKTVNVAIVRRGEGIHGRRKDIYGVNYLIELDEFKMKMWVGINVRRITTIFFISTSEQHTAEHINQIFKFSINGAEKVGYHSNFENSHFDGEQFVSIWSTVNTDNVILSHPAEQLFWAQDIAMMTQSLARTAIRNKLSLNTIADPSPL